MKTLIYKTAALAAFVAVMSCHNGNMRTDSVDSAKNTNDSLINDSLNRQHVNSGPVDKDDAAFAVEAANGNHAEVEMGKLAAANAANPRVKAFGEMMIKDHSEAGDKVKQIAASKNIVLPDSLGAEEQRHLEDLKSKHGAAFDRAYMDMMMDDHKHDISAFEKAMSNCKDADLKRFATTTLPVLQKHLDSVKAITGKQ